jgi:hypothetical protein
MYLVKFVDYMYVYLDKVMSINLDPREYIILFRPMTNNMTNGIGSL